MSQVYEALRRSGIPISAEQPDSKGSEPQQWAVLHNDKPAVMLDDAPLVDANPNSSWRIVALAENGNLGRETFVVLGTRLRHLQEKLKIKSVVVTSSSKGEGKSLVAANLAITLARSTRQKVLLLEGDLRQPVLSQLVGRDEHDGISDLLQSGPRQLRCLYRLRGLQLWLLFAGTRRMDPSVLLQSERLPQLLDQASDCFDWIVIDAPPLMPLADTAIWLRIADGAVLVVRENQTAKKMLQRAIETLGKHPLLSIVLNGARNMGERYYDAYYKKPLLRT
jgi:capsular exopolysaccharide synthesis family protein